MQTITVQNIARALGITSETARARLKGVPHGPRPERANRRDFPLVGVLRAVLPHKKTKPANVRELFQLATDDGSLCVSAGHLQIATPVLVALGQNLDCVLPEEAAQRYQRVRANLTASIANARGGAAYLPFLEVLHALALHDGAILRHVILGEPLDLDMSRWGAAFALVNAEHVPEVAA